MKDKNGNTSIPTKNSTIVSGIVIVIGLVAFFMIGGNSISRLNSGFSLFMLVLVIAIIGSLFHSFGNAVTYEETKRKYQIERQRLLRELHNFNS